MTDVIVRPVRGETEELDDLLVARFDDAEEDAWDGDGEEDWNEDDDWDDEDDDWDDEDDDWDDEDEEWGDDEEWEDDADA
jgi:hypothetical protein